MKAKLGQRAVVAFAVASLAGGASALFGGTALAGVHDNDTGGDGGAAGKVQSNCVLPIGANIGILGFGGENTGCSTTGGNGGAGGVGDSDY
jgi:hypothetical protein